MTFSLSRQPVSPTVSVNESSNWSHPTSPGLKSPRMESHRSEPRRLNTATSSTSNYTNLSASGWNASASAYMGKSAYRHQTPSYLEPGGSRSNGRTRTSSTLSPLPPPTPRPLPLQSQVYGLTADLRAHNPSSDFSEPKEKQKAFLLAQNEKANFSVEVFATQFDPRGYPVLSGRAASIKGIVRMPATTGCDVMMKITAHTTSGAPAAIWEGVAMAPSEFGVSSATKVFEVNDRLQANFDLVRPRDAFAPKNEELMEPPTLSKEDFVLPIPFDVKLPLGKSTRVVDGEVQAVAVALPPSFEISSKIATDEKKEMRMALKGKKGLSARDLVEKGFEKVYRIGCYYQITWTLLRDEPKKRSGKAQKEAADGDTLVVPFIFLGEPTSMPPHPPTIPSVLSPKVFTIPGTALGDMWDVHRSTAKWGGSMLKTTRRNVDIELHLPAPPVLQAPSHLPMLVIVRPNDPTLLSGIRPRSASGSSGPGSPNANQREDPIESMMSPQGRGGDSDGDSVRTTRSIVSRFIRPSISLARIPAGGSSVASSRRGAGGSGSSLFSSRRPNTAPSTGSSETAVTDSMSDRTYNPNGAVPDLSSLVCVSLIQTTFSSNEGVNDAPERRRKILSVADLEEVDIHALLLSSIPGGGSESGRTTEELAAIHEAAATAKAAGVRALVGSLTVNQNTAPSFRCQGLEVKYALKVDLLPISRIGGPDSMEKAFKNLGLRSGRSRGFSEGHSTTASIHTQTQFTQISTGSTPPTTPPSTMPPSSFGASPRSPSAVGVAYTTDEVTSPEEGSIARFPPSGRTSRWDSRQSVSGLSGVQSTMFMSEWGKDRKTVSKLHKTVGEMWIDVRLVRANSY